MASPEAFKGLFAARLIKEWSDAKVTGDRIQLMWHSLKHLPDEILEKCARSIVARNQYFPGADKCIAISLEIFRDHSRNTATPKEAPKKDCPCGGTGVRCVDNYAFQCPCPAGKLNYPNNPLYSGQAPFVEKKYQTEDSFITETRTGYNIIDKESGKAGFRYKEDPWRDHKSGSTKDEFGFEKRIPENQR